MKPDFNYQNWHLKHAEIWKKMPPPARPSPGEQAIFGKYLSAAASQKSGKLSILILGSTPEFRDMCSKNNFDTTCIDINEPIYEALTLLQEERNDAEKFICGNWLTFRSKQKYDIIIGDAVTAMFALKYYKTFFRNMFRHLKKDGLLLIRVPCQNDQFNLDPELAMQKYRQANKEKFIHIYTATYNYFARHFLNPESATVSLSYLYEKIQELHKKQVINKNEYSLLEPFYKNLTLILSYPTEERFWEEFRRYFRFDAKESGLDYPASVCNPVYVLRKTSAIIK